MAEGKPCVMRVDGGGSKFEARNLPERPPGSVERHVGGTLCPIGFTCNTCGHIVRKYAKITCFSDRFPKGPTGFSYTQHMFCPECFDEIVYEGANRSIISGGTVYIPRGCSDFEREPGFRWYPLDHQTA